MSKQILKSCTEHNTMKGSDAVGKEIGKRATQLLRLAEPGASIFANAFYCYFRAKTDLEEIGWTPKAVEIERIRIGSLDQQTKDFMGNLLNSDVNILLEKLKSRGVSIPPGVQPYKAPAEDSPIARALEATRRYPEAVSLADVFNGAKKEIVAVLTSVSHEVLEKVKEDLVPLSEPSPQPTFLESLSLFFSKKARNAALQAEETAHKIVETTNSAISEMHDLISETIQSKN